jgi:hypothetical protein
MKEELLALIKRYEPRSHYESYTNLYQTGRAEAYQLIIADLRFIL